MSGIPDVIPKSLFLIEVETDIGESPYDRKMRKTACRSEVAE